MKYINFSNVEELIFFDKKIQSLLPQRMFNIFEQWRLSQRVSFLRDIGKRALLDFLNSLENEDIDVLEEYFNEKIVIEKLNYSIASNYKIPLCKCELCKELCSMEWTGNFNTWRDKDFLYITFWR